MTSFDLSKDASQVRRSRPRFKALTPKVLQVAVCGSLSRREAGANFETYPVQQLPLFRSVLKN
jgi:hypothetical protein